MSKIKRESINFKLPKDLVEEVRSRAKELDTTATALVIQGLSIVLGMNQDINTDASLDANKSSIVEVESRLHKHVDTLLDSHLPAILNRLSLLEKGQSQIRQQLGSNDTSVDTSIDSNPNPVGADSVDNFLHQKAVDRNLHFCFEGGQEERQEEGTDNGVEPQSKATSTVNLPVKEKQNTMDGDHHLVDTPYTKKQLASYLGVSVSTIKSHTKKGKEHFENWSKTQDRHNSLSWSFDGVEPTEYYAIHNPTKLSQIS